MDTDMSEAELRKELIKQLGYDIANDAVWEQVWGHWQEIESGSYRKVLQRDADGDEWRESLVTEAERFLRRGKAAFGPIARQKAAPKMPPDPAPQFITSSEGKRAEATAIALAELAAGHPGVCAFREDVLRNRMLTEDEAIEFLHSKALALLSPAEMEHLGEPLLGHVGRLTSLRVGQLEDEHGVLRDALFVTVVIDRSGRAYRKSPVLTKPLLLQDEFNQDPKTWMLRSRGHWEVEMQVPVYGRLGAERIQIFRESTLDDLRVLAELLADLYLWWPHEAAMFVLTGDPPWFVPISSRYRAHGYSGAERAIITLEVEAWMPAETVARVYRARQRQITKGRMRSMGRPLEVFLFVSKKRRKSSKQLTWRELTEQWDSDHPTQAYDGNHRNFRRDYLDAQEKLVSPYGWEEEGPRWKG
jgi:hypothetical protein